MDYQSELDYELAVARGLEGKPVADDDGFSDTYYQAMLDLLSTMSAQHSAMVIVDLKGGGLVSNLTTNFIRRAARYAKGDQRPLVLPLEVANVYLEPPITNKALYYFERECLKCGYDVLDDVRALHFSCCLLCGGNYEPIDPGHGTRISRNYQGWSKANPDRAVDVTVYPGGLLAR